jgi:hypothetical protein
MAMIMIMVRVRVDVLWLESVGNDERPLLPP